MDQPTSGVRQPRFLLAIGGDPVLPVRLPHVVPAGTVVIAADSGLDRLVEAAINVHHVVGDLDSVAPEALALAATDGAVIDEHPADKDATDLELALDLVARLAGDRGGSLLVVGSGGGRLDHLLGDLLLLAAPRLAHLQVTAHLGAATISIVHANQQRQLCGSDGEYLSLLPVHGGASGVTTAGLRWPLIDADLVAGTSRAMSNEMVGSEASVFVGTGAVLVVQPGTHGPAIAPRSTPYNPTPRAPERSRDDR